MIHQMRLSVVVVALGTFPISVGFRFEGGGSEDLHRQGGKIAENRLTDVKRIRKHAKF